LPPIITSTKQDVSGQTKDNFGTFSLPYLPPTASANVDDAEQVSEVAEEIETVKRQ